MLFWPTFRELHVTCSRNEMRSHPSDPIAGEYDYYKAICTCVKSAREYFTKRQLSCVYSRTNGEMRLFFFCRVGVQTSSESTDVKDVVDRAPGELYEHGPVLGLRGTEWRSAVQPSRPDAVAYETVSLWGHVSSMGRRPYPCQRFQGTHHHHHRYQLQIC